MKRFLGLALVALAGLALTSSSPAVGLDSGTWKLTTVSADGSTEATNWLFTLETEGGKTTASLLGASPAATKAKAQLVSFTSAGDRVRLTVKTNAEKVFEGRINKDGKIFGVMSDAKTAVAAYMAPTTMKAIASKTITSKLSLTDQELRSLGETAAAVAKEMGPRWSVEVNLQMTTAFLRRKDSKLAVDFARSAEKMLGAKSSSDLQVKVLETLEEALKKAGAPVKEQTKVATRLNTLNAALDAEYLSKAPAFKAAKFAGRKGGSERVVLMELFTGAQCPPCVASDVAFDELEKNYNSHELVLLQYHLHIPGPDPMTNPATEARAKFYKVNSTPSMLINGAKKMVGGGGVAAAEKKYGDYRAVINPLLETGAECNLTVSAKRVGSKIQLQAHVAGVEKPGENIKLRLVLAEETIRFVGANKLRFHHQVVRAMPGTAAGVAVMNPTMSVKQEVDLNALRQRLDNYLDDYAATKRAFPQPSRPMNMEHLRAIALVQDDATHEILQVVQVPVVD